jgi:hypothetical protein
MATHEVMITSIQKCIRTQGKEVNEGFVCARNDVVIIMFSHSVS